MYASRGMRVVISNQIEKIFEASAKTQGACGSGWEENSRAVVVVVVDRMMLSTPVTPQRRAEDPPIRSKNTIAVYGQPKQRATRLIITSIILY